MFPELVELYKERKRAAVAAGERVDEQTSVTVPSEDDEVQGILAAGAAVIAILSILFALRFM